MAPQRSPEPDRLGEMRDALVQVSFAVMAILTRVAAEHDLSLTQLRALGILRDREPTVAELASFMGLERSTVSGLIDRAAQRGLVHKTSDPADGRSVRVSLTAEAQRLQHRVIAEIDQPIVSLAAHLTDSELARLTALLLKTLGQ